MDYIKPLYSHTSLISWQKANLDYNWYWVLAVFFGWCALDQLYLGSPYGFLAKNFVNMNTFGYWYFYDLIRATFDQESVKFTGPGIPGLGAPGLAAGRFQRPEAPLLPESKTKHKNFFLYTIVLFVFGFIGGDSFLLGNNLSGIIRLCCVLSFIFMPIAIIWWIYRVIVYLLYPTYLLEQEWKFFDYPKPGNMPATNNIFMDFTIWVLKTLEGLLYVIPGVNFVIAPLVTAIRSSLEAAYGMASRTVAATTGLFSSVAEAGTLLIDDSKSAMPRDLEALTEQMKTLSSGKTCATAQAGGGSSASSTPALALFLSTTLGLIIVSGIVLSLRRSYQNPTNGSTKDDGNAKKTSNDKSRGERSDAPPDPGASGDPTPTATDT